ncbi:hypothetical protein O181_031608 [Austropuccinia psidii MF-1]|uniref:Uncharacterized protein n=1 Tax=Austropuccinia psidii MF-1 TaxID=1389203 RepID=A0A9Q3D016_9BASI|nr:hypothetical protein [Austropuccinia psidii MF-1]
MQAIFGNKQNVVGFNVLDTTTNTEVGEDSDENNEVSSDKSMEKSSNSPPQTKVEDCDNISCQNDYMHNEKQQRDKGTSCSDDSNASSRPQFVELKAHYLSSKMSPKAMKETKGKGHKSAGQQPALTDKLVSKQSNSMLGVLEHKLDTQDNQILQQLHNNLQFNYDQDKISNDHKLLDLKGNREVRMIEINYQGDLEQEKFRLKKQKDKRAEELHNVQL